MKSKVVSHLWIIALKIIAFSLRCSREQQNTQRFIALLRCRLFGSEPVACRSERKPLVSAEFHIEDEPAISPLVHRPRNQQERLQDPIFRYPSPLSQLCRINLVQLELGNSHFTFYFWFASNSVVKTAESMWFSSKNVFSFKGNLQ